jgi:hypothetical protein
VVAFRPLHPEDHLAHEVAVALPLSAHVPIVSRAVLSDCADVHQFRYDSDTITCLISV